LNAFIYLLFLFLASASNIKELVKDFDSKELIVKIGGYKVHILVFLYSIIYTGVLVYIKCFGDELQFIIYIIAFSAWSVAWFLANRGVNSYKKKYDVEFNENLIRNKRIFLLLIFLLFANMFYAAINARDLIAGESSERVTIEYKGKMIRTSRHYMYVGRTKGYTFFYNTQTGFAHVYPNSSIERMYRK